MACTSLIPAYLPNFVLEATSLTYGSVQTSFRVEVNLWNKYSKFLIEFPSCPVRFKSSTLSRSEVQYRQTKAPY